jgi:hypothetical protein
MVGVVQLEHLRGVFEQTFGLGVHSLWYYGLAIWGRMRREREEGEDRERTRIEVEGEDRERGRIEVEDRGRGREEEVEDRGRGRR